MKEKMEEEKGRRLQPVCALDADVEQTTSVRTGRPAGSPVHGERKCKWHMNCM